MALRLLWFPSTLSTEQKPQNLSLYKPSNTSSTSFISYSSQLSTTRRRKANLFICQVSSAIEQQSPSANETPKKDPNQEPQTRLIAQNIPWSATSEDIRKLFEKHGNVADIELSMYSKSRNRGLAFITMSSEAEALEALTKLNSSEVEGRSITVAYAKAKNRRPPAVTSTLPKYDVFVANLSWKVKSRDLIKFFESVSEDVITAEVTYQMTPTRKPTGYGFVSFHSKEKAEEAISAFQGKELMGKPVRLALSTRSQKAETLDDTNSGETSTEMNAGGITGSAEKITT